MNPAQYCICITIFIAQCCIYITLFIALFTVCGGNEITQSVFVVTLTLQIARCTVYNAHCTLLHTKLQTVQVCTALPFSQCALHLPVYTLQRSQIVFMVTLALLTRARYSQKLDHGDLDQMTLGGNRTNIVWMNCEFSMKVKFGQIWTVWQSFNMAIW